MGIILIASRLHTFLISSPCEDELSLVLAMLNSMNCQQELELDVESQMQVSELEVTKIYRSSDVLVFMVG